MQQIDNTLVAAQGCFDDTHMRVIKMVHNFLGTCCDILLTVKNPGDCSWNPNMLKAYTSGFTI
jgi:hypothetical protein